MKILVLSDLHSQRSALSRLDSHLRGGKYSGVFMLGDLANRNDPKELEFAKQFIKLIKENYKLPLFAVHGNQESLAVKFLYQRENISVHFQERSLAGYSIIGVGYGEAVPAAKDFAKGKILLTHEPPRASSIKEMKKKANLLNAPIIHFSGHLHRKQLVHNIGSTILVQTPAAQNKKAAVLELPKREIKFISF